MWRRVQLHEVLLRGANWVLRVHRDALERSGLCDLECVRQCMLLFGAHSLAVDWSGSDLYGSPQLAIHLS